LTKDGELMIVGTVYELSGDSIESSRTEFELDGSELSMGDPNAAVTVIEFSDFQCPFCKQFYSNTIQDLKTNYIDTGKVYFVYKHFPLSFHSSAQIASEATECANEQGVWYEYHEKIFNSQNGDFGVSELNQWAIGIVSDTSAFNECLDSGKYSDKVNADTIEGQSVGVSGTPATFVNGIMLSGAQPYSVFKELIDSELNK
jgi:protein-disulfide isomerase